MFHKSILYRIKKLERKACCNRIYFYNDFNSFPEGGRENILYVDKSDGSVYVWDNDLEEYEQIVGYSDSFLDLLDTPQDYVDSGGSLLVVSNDESGVEFIDLGDINLSEFNIDITTDDVPEGNNQYFTDQRVSNNSDVSANTNARHEHGNFDTLENIIDSGDGSKYFGDDGQYHELTDFDSIVYNHKPSDEIIVSGTDEQSIINPSQGSAVLTSSGMVEDYSYHGHLYGEVSADANDDYTIRFYIGTESVEVTIGVDQQIENGPLNIKYDIDFLGGDENNREVVFSGFVNETAIPPTVKTINASGIQTIDITFEGSGGSNEIISYKSILFKNKKKVADKQFFISTWDTALPGESDNDEILLPTWITGSYDFKVYYNGQVLSHVTNPNDNLIQFPDGPGVKTVVIEGRFWGIRFNNEGDCKKIINIQSFGKDFDVRRGANRDTIAYSFYGCSNLKRLPAEELNTENVSTMASTFNGCTSLKTLDVSNWNTESVTTMASTFNGCTSLKTLDVSNWNTESVTTMASTFRNCSSLKTLDVSNWNTESVTTMANTFRDCSSLETLDVSNWNTESVTTMANTFRDCTSLKTLDVSNWNTESVTTMESTFNGCTSLKTLDVSNWNTESVTTMANTFRDCSSLETLDVSNWGVEEVTNMTSTFNGCTSLKTLDVSNWNTESVTTMASTFRNCSSLETLDVSNWGVEEVTNFGVSFAGGASANTQTYDQTLCNWSQQNLNSNLSIDFGNSKYSNIGEACRDDIINNFGWTIVDGGAE